MSTLDVNPYQVSTYDDFISLNFCAPIIGLAGEGCAPIENNFRPAIIGTGFAMAKRVPIRVGGCKIMPKIILRKIACEREQLAGDLRIQDRKQLTRTIGTTKKLLRIARTTKQLLAYKE